MTPENVTACVSKFVEDEFAKMGTKLKMKLDWDNGGKPWAADPKHWNYAAAARATKVRFIDCNPCGMS